MSASVKKNGYWIKKIALWCSGTLILLFFLGALGVYLLCTYKSDMVCAFVEQELNQITEMQWKLKGELRPHFSPALGISFSNIELSNHLAEEDGSKHHFTARRLRLEPDVLALLQGRFAINKLFIDNPIITLKESTASLITSDALPADLPVVSLGTMETEQNAPSKVQVGSQYQQNLLPANGVTPPDTDPATVSNNASSSAESVEGVVALSESEATAEGLSPLFREIRRSIKRDVQKRLDQVYLTDGHFTQVSSEGEAEITFSDINAVFHSRTGEKSTLSAKTSLPEYGLESQITLTMVLPENEPELLLKGTLDLSIVSSIPKAKAVGGNIRSDFVWQKKGNRLAVSNLQFEGEGDRFTANAVFDPRTITTTGTLHIERLSFPRWFYFARNLPPGLQHLLHSVSGSTDFIITDIGARAMNLKATARDKNITGSVEVKSFLLPVVEVNVALEKTDLDTIFSFLAASEKKVPDLKEPKFDTPYLIPYSAGPSSSDAPDVGYSVQVTVPEAIVHSITAKKLMVSVFPIENNVARVLFSGREFSGGTVSGRLDIDTDIVKMQYVVKNVGLGALPENKNSSVTFDGALSATVDLTVPVKNGHWADVWDLKGTGSIANLKITNVPEKWHISSKSAGISATGSVHTLRSKGLRLEGQWNLKADGVLSSWNTIKQDALQASLKGSLAWPAAGNTSASGLYHIYGDLKTTGQLVLPIGTQRVPVRGEMTSPLDWRIDTGIIQFTAMRFKGHGSSVTGNLVIDASQQNTVVTSAAAIHLAPRTLLADWNLFPTAFKVPKMLAGKGKLRSEGGKTSFIDLNLMADLATVRGKVETSVVSGGPQNKGDADSILVSTDLIADVINFDYYFPPATPEELKKNPSTIPWDLTSVQGIDINSVFNIEKAIFRKVNLGRTETKTTLNKGKFSFITLSSDVYGGKATFQANGILNAFKSTIALQKAMLVIKAVSLNLAFYELNEGNSYGGMADMVIDVSGLMKCSADLPAALSGAWSIEIRDGLYPAFLGSDTAGLRNTFREAVARGPMEKGVLKTESFRMTGSMVDMTGSGWVDLGKSTLDLQIRVAMAQGPTIPVRFSGGFSDMIMDVSGSRVVVGTAAAAGVSVFYLFKGILELPARAVLGVGGALSSDKPIQPKEYAPKPSSGAR